MSSESSSYESSATQQDFLLSYLQLYHKIQHLILNIALTCVLFMHILALHTCFAAVNAEVVLLTNEALCQARALSHNLAGIGLDRSALLRTADGTGHRVYSNRGGFMHTVAGHKLGT